MTKEEMTICKIYLEDIDKTHDCNEYKLLMALLEQQPSDDKVSTEVYKQVIRERDIAIEQLKELGYGFGEKIRTSEDCVSREQAKMDVIPNSLYTSEQVIALLDNLSPVTPTFPKGATNGDMFKTVFPFIEVKREISSTSDNIVVRDNSFFGAINRFHRDWWYALYKRER